MGRIRWSVCPDCREPHEGTGRCNECRRAADRQRGSATRRGYGQQHQTLRAQWAPRVAAGDVTCWRCGEPIAPDEPWHLGHDDEDRNRYRGPEHVACNCATAGRAS